MSSVLDRSELEQSPLADLHLLANELGVDGFRRLRRDDLIDAIVSRQGGEAVASEPAEPAQPAEPAEPAQPAEPAEIAETETDEDAEDRRPRRGRRGGRGR